MWDERIEFLKKIVDSKHEINNEVEEKQYNNALINIGISDIGLQFNKPIVKAVENQEKGLREILYIKDKDKVKDKDKDKVKQIEYDVFYKPYEFELNLNIKKLGKADTIIPKINFGNYRIGLS